MRTVVCFNGEQLLFFLFIESSRGELSSCSSQISVVQDAEAGEVGRGKVQKEIHTEAKKKKRERLHYVGITYYSTLKRFSSTSSP